ncbi:MAG: hypothetical protein ACK5L7_05780 [Paludibacteraceae bacterium]
MKPINLIILSVIITGIFTSCEDFNKKNFSGYEDLTRPKNLVNYNYTMTSADFSTLGDMIKKDVETAISKEQTKLTTKKNELKTATNAEDSARINNEYNELKIIVDKKIAELKLDSAYATGMYLKTNKYFDDNYPASDYAPLFLNTKYKYADQSSTVQFTYKYVNLNDTTSIVLKDRYTMTVDDYNSLGEAPNQPGQYDNFSATIDPDTFIPKLLTVKYPLAQKGDLRLIRYMFYVSAPAVQRTGIYTFDGSMWIPYSKTEQYLFAESHEWVFDPTIWLTPAKEDFLLLMPYIYANDGKTLPEMTGLNEWTENDVIRFVINPAYPPASNQDFNNVRTEFFFGTSWYYANIDVRIISRTYNTDKELMEYFSTVDSNDSLSSDQKKEVKTAFMEKRVKQGLALILFLKYPDLEPETKGLTQFVKLNVQLYDGSRWYWTYKYKCVEKGKFDFVERVKWK